MESKSEDTAEKDQVVVTPINALHQEVNMKSGEVVANLGYVSLPQEKGSVMKDVDFLIRTGKYDTGESNSISIDNEGNCVEVHVGAERLFGTERLFYRVGKADFDANKITWWPSIPYDTGGPNSISINNDGECVEVHVGTERLFHRVGRVDFDAHIITWGPSTQYDTGELNSISINNNGSCVEVHVSAERLFHRVGIVDFDCEKIIWGPSIPYDTGESNSISIDNEGNCVEVHVGAERLFGTERLFYRVGKIDSNAVDFDDMKVIWGPSIPYDTGGPNSISIDNNGNCVEVHVGTERLFYRVGRVDFDAHIITWGPSTQYDPDTSGPNSVSLNDNSRCAGVYVVSEDLFYRAGIVNFRDCTIDFKFPPIE